jgi:hypothetical protein
MAEPKILAPPEGSAIGSANQVNVGSEAYPARDHSAQIVRLGGVLRPNQTRFAHSDVDRYTE